jgi:hypothetical protein
MITPQSAAAVMVALTIFLMVLIPMLDASKRFGKYVSLRYTVTTVMVIMAVGCVLDFSHLVDSTRDLVILGAIILSALFVLVRSIEKIKLKGTDIQLKGEYKGAKAEVNVTAKDGGDDGHK